MEASRATGGGPGMGPRLRAARRRRGMSLAALADASDLTKGFLSQVERDLVSPSVGSLLRVCDALGVGVGELFEAGDSLTFDAGSRRRWWNASPVHPVRVLWVIVPALR